MSRRYFIAGTDTGVGKTYIAAKLLASMCRDAGKVAYIKPFQTGCTVDRGGRMVVPDVDDIKALLGESVDCHVLHRYELPACPLLAARAAGTSIDFSSAVKWTGEKAEGCGAAVIEGAGGLLVPLTAEKTMLDFIAAVGYPVILVAPNRLGCINHSLLSIRAMEDRGIHLEALVLNNLRPVEPDEVERANAEMIRIFAPGTRILEVGYGDDFSL